MSLLFTRTQDKLRQLHKTVTVSDTKQNLTIIYRLITKSFQQLKLFLLYYSVQLVAM